MATFYSAASNPGTASLDSASYSKAETRVVNRDSAAFACANCWAAARFHGFLKASGACSPALSIAIGASRTYVSGTSVANTWETADTATPTMTCANGQYVEIFHETRSTSSSNSHAIAGLLLFDTGSNPLSTSSLFAAYAISNTPVPLTVTS
jgi:hypothetical protein